MQDIHDDLRANDRRAFARAFFRTIACGKDEMPTKPWPSFRCWEPRPRTDLPDCMIPAQRKRPLRVTHGPFFAGKQQPIRKRWDALKNRYVTNEV